MNEHIKKSINIAELISDNLGKPETSYPKDLQEWLAASPKNREILNSIQNGEHLYSRIEFYDSIDSEEEWELLQIKRAPEKVKLTYQWRWVSSVAAVLLLAFILGYFLIPSNDTLTMVDIPFTGEDITAGKTMATLFIGKNNISIDENMQITTQEGSTTIVDQSGNPIYTNDKKEKPQINKLLVPRGGEYYIELEDGTKVWLNAESELQFPEYFEKDKRLIAVKGEAYIEVSHDPQRAFYVQTGNVQVHVVGTSFNVRNFSDEDNLSIALAKGKVLMENMKGELLTELAPSKQFVMNETTEIFHVETVNLQTVLAWKNRIFAFDKEPLISIVKKLERWYNVQIEVDPTLQNRRYSGSLNKYETMEEIISVLQKTKELRFVKDQHQNIKIIPVESN